MTEFVFGSCRLAVDTEANRAWYAAHPLPWVTCDCAGCRNFLLAVKRLPPAVTAFFGALGLDPEKPGEACWYWGTPETVYGGGWYHLAGVVPEGLPAPGQRQTAWFPITEGFEAAFKPDCDLLPEDFPRPCFQMELDWALPWLLEEPNPYLSTT